MKVKLLTSRATVNGANHFGEIIDVEPREAKALIATQQAEPVGRSTPARPAKGDTK